MTAANWITASVGAVTANTRRGGDLRMLFGPAVGCGRGLFGHLLLKPGEAFREHYHPYSDEAILVVRGALIARLDDQLVSLQAGESALIPANVRHRLASASDDDTEVVFALYGLAPRPDLGHVETEDPISSDPSSP